MRLSRSSSRLIAPDRSKLLEDKDLKLYIDGERHSYHHVEMRGEWTMDGIFLKTKDVGAVFQSPSFVNTIQRCGSTYSLSEDYVVFRMPKPHPCNIS